MWCYIYDILLQDGGGVTHWCCLVPLKLNIILWRVLLDWIHYMVNLTDRKVDIPSIICPSCELQVDDSHHVFVHYDVAMNVWRRVLKCLNLPLLLFNNVANIWSWMDSNSLLHSKKKAVKVIVLTTIWTIWTFRNGVVFQSIKLKISFIFL